MRLEDLIKIANEMFNARYSYQKSFVRMLINRKLIICTLILILLNVKA